ncbi:MAG: YiiX/YebB-like N1pC/P60 family cysteine hydrolase [Gammaproteobacteria bacterium]|nr:YiiX/YebB-like N1pC/P60 family cysteine hydrolase [Gammaproteobacteria bacterium]
MKNHLLFWIRDKLWDGIWKKTVAWLNTEKDSLDLPPNDFRQLCYEIRPGDVILVEGRSHISEVIKLISQSAWTHSALYIGHLYEIKDPQFRKQAERYYQGDPDAPLIIEALLGEGTVIHPVSKYRHDHLRICRPSNITPKDAQKVIEFSIGKLGSEYHVRQLLDLARFIFPYSLVPRRWRSSLFLHNTGPVTRTVCSSMISEAFQQIQFPILPVTEKLENGQYNLYMRNPRLMTPKDFDFSPYFEIIKYPIYGFDHIAMYKKMPWNEEGIICHAPGDCYLPEESMASESYPEVQIRHKINLLRKRHKLRINEQKTPTDGFFSASLSVLIVGWVRRLYAVTR